MLEGQYGTQCLKSRDADKAVNSIWVILELFHFGAMTAVHILIHCSTDFKAILTFIITHPIIKTVTGLCNMQHTIASIKRQNDTGNPTGCPFGDNMFLNRRYNMFLGQGGQVQFKVVMRFGQIAYPL